MPQTIITLGLLGELGDVNEVLAVFRGSHGRSETKELGFAIQCGFFGGSGSERERQSQTHRIEETNNIRRISPSNCFYG